jgi:hypothetical protein
MGAQQMDKKEHIKGSITEDVGVKSEAAPLGNIFEKITGWSMSVGVVTYTEDDKNWECRTAITIGITDNVKDEKWVTASLPVKSLDTNPEDAIATALIAISNFVSDDNVYKALLEQLESRAEVSEEPSEV